MQVVVPAAGYYSDPHNPGSLETEALFGEKLTLLGERGDYFEVQSKHYATPAFVRRKEVDVRYITPTHRVCVPYANVYHQPNFKSGVSATLCLNAQVRVLGGAPSPEGQMLQVEDLGWVFEEQLILSTQYLRDFVEVARSRIGALPYTWGGRFHPDCSGLLMDSLLACGIPCPRNVSEQARTLGQLFEPSDFSDFRRGDLVFWERHVVIMTSPTHCVHSTIAKGCRSVVEQDLIEAIHNQEKAGNGGPVRISRLPQYSF